MNDYARLVQLAHKVNREICGDVLPFWTRMSPDERNGGFVGQITGQGTVNHEADKGIILNTRILWTFSAAYRIYGKQEYLELAHRSFDYLTSHFWDHDQGGVYWSVTSKGKPSDSTKYLYAQAFALYGLSEYCRAVPGAEALDYATRLYNLIEENCFCPDHNGYHEVFSRQWQQLNGIPLGSDELSSKFSMNTHLHLMEAYANFYRIRCTEVLAARLHNLILLHTDKMFDPSIGHFYCYFDQDWQRTSRRYSYGHDIEAAWLLLDAARLLDNPDLTQTVETIACKIGDSTILEGVDARRGGLFSTGKLGQVIDCDKEWWAQAEAVVGFVYLWQLQGKDSYLQAAKSIWEFISNHVKDTTLGEWFFLVDADGNPYREYDKIGPWKCPYHSSRCAMELRSIFATVNS